MTLRATVSLAAAALATLVSAASGAPVPTLAPDQLHPGQTAVVRTVFRGDSIETFEASIVGVLKGGASEGDMILARATSERVIRSGVAAGMSGSPVYVDGKLIGALSSGWAFTRDPLFGITPIGEMLGVLDLPAAVPGASSAGPTGVEAPSPSSRVTFGAFQWAGDDDEVEPIEPDDLRRAPPDDATSAAPRPLWLPLAAGGLHPLARAWLAPRLDGLGLALTAGGRGTAPKAVSPTLEPGSAVAVDVLRGDLRLSAIGTVTWRDGDRVLLFGHPFFQSGDVNLPLSRAEIVTIVASQQSSFKLGVPGDPIGAATQDRRSAVAGRLGPAPSLLPFGLEVRSAGRTQRFRFETIEDRALAPLLISTAALNGLLESGGTASNQTFAWTLTLHRRGAPPLVIRDLAVGESPVQELAGAVASPIRFLLGNPFERVRFDSLRLEVERTPGRALWTVRNAGLIEPLVRPGATAHLRVELERWRGGRETRELAIPIPEELPDGRYTLLVGGGAELTRYEAAKLPGRYRPASLEEAWSRIARMRRNDALYAAVFARAPEVTREGRDYPELPVSALAVLAGPTLAGDLVRRGDLAVLDERSLAFPGAVRGELVLALQVDSKAP